MSTTVTYKGSTLTTVNNQTRTLKTAGKYMEDDVTLVDVSSTGGYVTQDQDGFIVLPPDGGSSPSVGGLEYEVGIYTPTNDVASDQVTISFANPHTDKPIFIVMVDQTGVYDDTLNTQYYWDYVNHCALFGNPIYVNTTLAYYAQGYNRARGSNATSMTGNAVNYTSQQDNHVSSENFKPNYSENYYYRSGHTYKWIAVWAPTT